MICILTSSGRQRPTALACWCLLRCSTSKHLRTLNLTAGVIDEFAQNADSLEPPTADNVLSADAISARLLHADKQAALRHSKTGHRLYWSLGILWLYSLFDRTLTDFTIATWRCNPGRFAHLCVASKDPRPPETLPEPYEIRTAERIRRELRGKLTRFPDRCNALFEAAAGCSVDEPLMSRALHEFDIFRNAIAHYGGRSTRKTTPWLNGLCPLGHVLPIKRETFYLHWAYAVGYMRCVSYLVSMRRNAYETFLDSLPVAAAEMAGSEFDRLRASR